MSRDFDVIVVGSGISGGWAAKEFTERGYSTLVLERGEPLSSPHYPTEGVPPWKIPNAGRVPLDEVEQDYPVQGRCYAFSEYTKHHFINDRENPYEWEEGRPFDWIRGSKVGGRSLLWHRQSYRWSDYDFSANKRDKHGVDWPIRYRDVAPWYDHVERFAGISGNRDGLSQLPDGVFQKPHEMLDVEKHIKRELEKAYPGRNLIIGRCAHLTEPTPEQLELGRGLCQSRNECQRGCSWGGYFSSQSATLPAAERTGLMTLRANAVVDSVAYDSASGRVSGVRWVDATSGEKHFSSARLIFLCASTLASTQILLNSRTDRFPNGLGNDSGVLGHYLMDHVAGAGASGDIAGFEGFYYKGRRPTPVYIPRFAGITEPQAGYVRGFGYQGGAYRQGWAERPGNEIGRALKDKLRSPGKWRFSMVGFGEMLPQKNNRVSLNNKKLDRFDIPLLRIDCTFGDNEAKIKKAIAEEGASMLKAAGLGNVTSYQSESYPGIAIHEMGTARMGRDPATSFLNGFNQSHAVANLFVTDGSAFASSACQNPSLTYMALTARAVAYADKQVQAGVI